MMSPYGVPSRQIDDRSLGWSIYNQPYPSAHINNMSTEDKLKMLAVLEKRIKDSELKEGRKKDPLYIESPRLIEGTWTGDNPVRRAKDIRMYYDLHMRYEIEQSLSKE